jgi:hypothetical protein
MPKRRASIAASISALAGGGALRYRARSSGAPARNWITSPSGADRAASAMRASAARASWPICAGVNAAGTVMSCPASSSRAGRAGRRRWPGGQSGCPRTRATWWPAPAPGPGRVRAAAPAAWQRPARPARPRPGRCNTGLRSARSRSAALRSWRCQAWLASITQQCGSPCSRSRRTRRTPGARR